MPKSNDGPQFRLAERIIHSLGNRLALNTTHTDQCRRRLAELAVIIEASES